MSSIKMVASLLFVALLAASVFAIYGLYNLDQIIKDSIIEIGSRTTATPVTLEQANISLRSGEGQLTGLQVANPLGYKSPYAFALDNISITIAPKSIMGKVIIIQQISIDGAKLIAEEQGFKRLNLHQIHQNIIDRLPQQKQTPQGSNKITNKRFMIEKLVLENNNLRLVTEKFGEKNLTLANFSITNIGDKQKGLTPDELATAVMNPVLTQATNAVKEALKTLTGSHGKDALKKMAENKLGL